MIDLRRTLNAEAKRASEAEHLLSVATALTRAGTLSDVAHIVAKECQSALKADAVCVYMEGAEDLFEMTAEIGCTEEFKRDYNRIPRDKVPLMNLDDPTETMFFGSAKEFKDAVPAMDHDLVEKSKRQTIAYAPLVVNGHAIGFLGFSFNQVREHRPEIKTFVLTLVNFCAQALERMRLIEQERSARADAEAANRAKSEFIANISHEIRTPLAVIQGYADLLFESRDIGPTQRQWAAVMRRNTRQLASILGEVLDISKIEAEKVEIEKLQFSLWELIDDIRTVAAFKTRDSRVEFRFSSNDVPEFVFSDPTRIRQILLNLITNSIKFTSMGYVKLDVRMRFNSLLEFIIEDTGLGISPEQHDRIFEPFKQADSSTSRKFGGAGLGLSISRKLARALGGDVVLMESAPNQGSIFKFVVPIESSRRDQKREASDTLNPERSHNQLSGLKVLLVDDSPDNRELVSLILQREGARVDVADCGIKGIELAARNKYQVILMDIQMPDIDGHEALKQIRQSGCHIPVAALTARALNSEREKSLNEGFDEYLTKPIDVPMLIQSVKKLGRVNLPH